VTSSRPRVRAVVHVLLSAGLAVSGVGLRPALADSPAPTGLPSALPSGAGTSISSPALVSGGASVSATAPSVSVKVQVSASPPLPGASPVSVSAGVQAGASTAAAPTIGRASVSVGAGTLAGVSASTAPASGGVLAASGGAGTGAENPSGPAAATSAAAPTSAGAAGHDPPVVCSQLVFRPLVAGCQALIGPITGRGLAPTGTPLLIGLVGMLLILAGWLTCRRFRPRARTVGGAGGRAATRPRA
jgi:hypothetical protein